MSSQLETDYEESQVPNVTLRIHSSQLKESVIVEALGSDSVMEVCHYLSEIGETCELTSYHFEFNGVKLVDLTTLSQYPELMDAPEVPKDIQIVLDNYDEKSAKAHFHKLREILVNPPLFSKNVSLMDDITSYKSVSKDLNTRIENLKKHTGNRKIVSRKEQEVELQKQRVAEGNNDYFSEMTVDEFYASTKAEVPRCLNNIRYSNWNPVSGARRLKGDLFYIDVTTLDNKFIGITSTRNGFYVNQSTASNFNPIAAVNQNAFYSHSLCDLLRNASHTFALGWVNLVTRKVAVHPLESQTDQIPNKQWMVAPVTQRVDWNASDRSYLTSFGVDLENPNREWNEEFQLCKELPNSQPQERLMRDRTVNRISLDFISAAIDGAKGIVEGCLTPVNNADPKMSHLYIINNIFFSMPYDSKGNFTGFGDSLALHVNAKSDLTVLESIANLGGINGVGHVNTTLIDYKGHRIIAQALIPGIFNFASTNHVYASMDFGKTFSTKELSESALSGLKRLGELMHIKPSTHCFTDKDNLTHTVNLYTGGRGTGVMGSDKRFYLLDLSQTLPRDMNYTDASEASFVMRPELVNLYCRSKAFEEAVSKVKKEKTDEPEAETNTVVDTESEKTADGQVKEMTEEEKAKKAKKAAEAEELNKRRREEYFQALYKMQFNCDLFTSLESTLVISDEQRIADTASLNDLALFLKETVIAGLIESWKPAGNAPTDAQVFTELLEKKGVPLRYLGYIATTCTEKADDSNNLANVAAFIRNEMVSRAMKSVVNSLLKDYTSGWYKDHTIESFSDLLSTLLSNLFGSLGFGVSVTEDILSTATEILAEYQTASKTLEQALIDESVSEISVCTIDAVLPVIASKFTVAGVEVTSDRTSVAMLWAAVVSMVQKKYKYALPTDYSVNNLDKLNILKSLCLQTGIEISAAKIDFSLECPISEDMLLDIKPVVKSFIPASKDGQDAFDTGKSFLSQGILDHALAYFEESCNIFMQTSGTLCMQLAELYTSISPLIMNGGDATLAIDYIYRALIIISKLKGIDHPFVASTYVQLSFFLISIDKPLGAIKYLRRALFIMTSVSGENSMDAITCLFNIALAYHEGGHAKKANQCINEAIRRVITVYGASHPVVSRFYEAQAMMAYSAGKFTSALAIQTKSFEIMKQSVLENESEEAKTERLASYDNILKQFTVFSLLETKGPKEEYQKIVNQSKQSLDEHAICSMYWSDVRGLTSENVLSVENMLKLLESNETLQTNTNGDMFIPYKLGGSNTVYTKK